MYQPVRAADIEYLLDLVCDITVYYLMRDYEFSDFVLFPGTPRCVRRRKAPGYWRPLGSMPLVLDLAEQWRA